MVCEKGSPGVGRALVSLQGLCDILTSKGDHLKTGADGGRTTCGDRTFARIAAESLLSRGKGKFKHRKSKKRQRERNSYRGSVYISLAMPENGQPWFRQEGGVTGSTHLRLV